MARRILRAFALLAFAGAVAWAWVDRPARAGAAERTAGRPGASPSAEPTVRLRLFASLPAAQLQIHGRPRVTHPGLDRAVEWRATARGTVTLRAEEAGVLVGADRYSSVTVDPDDGQPLVLVWSPGADQEPRTLALRHPVEFVRVLARTDPRDPKKVEPRLRAILHIPLETYLQGVVAGELDNGWPPESLKAQAVAARTYALWAIGLRPDAETHLSLGDMAWNPARVREAGNAAAAVDATAGVAMLERGRFFPAYFSSECGGATADARLGWARWTTYFTALGGVRCERCATLPAARLNKHSDRTWGFNEVAERLRAAGWIEKGEQVVNLRAHAAETAPDGRLRPAGAPLPPDRLARAAWIVVVTDRREAPVLANEFRMAVDPTSLKTEISSTWLALESRAHERRVRIRAQGWGHGVGMCQYGARHRAEAKREGYAAILRWYYPGVELRRVYR